MLFPNNNTEGSQITQDTPTTTTTTTNGSAFDPGDSFPLAQRPDFVFGSLDFTQFQAMLEILQAKGNAKLVASPQITALDGVEARIHIGETIPVPTYSRNEQYNVTYVTGYQDRDVGTTMLVTPHVNDDRTVTLDVRPEVSVITGYVGQFHEVPIVAKRRAETQVRLVYGRTLVIGGLVRDKEITRESKVPLLGDIPLLGYLFRYQSTETEKTDLLIFVTPTIVDQDQEEQQSSGKQEFHGAWIPTEDAQRYERILATACHRDALQRMQAARDLGLLRTDAERALIQPADVLARMLLADPDEQVRIAAGRALMRCDPRAFVGAITEIRERRDTGQIQTLLLLALNEEVIDLRRATFATAIAIDADATVRSLGAALGVEGAARARAAEALGWYPSDAARAALERGWQATSVVPREPLRALQRSGIAIERAELLRGEGAATEPSAWSSSAGARRWSRSILARRQPPVRARGSTRRAALHRRSRPARCRRARAHRQRARPPRRAAPKHYVRARRSLRPAHHRR
ncbi:MAG: type II and III secretion system protein [Planctomycetota bacterium]